MGNTSQSPKKILKGFCHFFSETGTEGGDWTFQDEKFIQKNVKRGYCKKCKVEVDVLGATFKKVLNNITFIKGTCAVCGSKIWASCRKKPADDTDKK